MERARNAEDGRAVDVLITPAGAALADTVHAEVARSLAPLAGVLTGPDQRRLRALLETMLTR